ncbi:MAG TPA: hypothetical protein VEQ42_04045 [Pyrinomonadaceae bacterium]|nr:hypothetical protein [Pyrinomonadaceae bacterium]
MTKPIRILLQTTIPATPDDWGVERFSLLREHLASVKDEARGRSCEVVARDIERGGDRNDPVLSALDRSDFDELWLFAVDTGDGLSTADCAGITRFRQRGGGLLTTRDHQDLGSCLCTLGGVGLAHFFHTRNPEPDPSRRRADDTATKDIAWPNYHSGRNGDYQKITAVEPVHELLLRPGPSAGAIEFFPAHPHEGAVGVPEGEQDARVIATGTSLTTARPFNLAVAFERAADEHGNRLGRAVAQSSFHHFVDYNWDTEAGCPSFVAEAPGDQIKRDPRPLDDIKTYTRNLALWLAPEN